MMDKVNDRLSSWKVRNISFVGRLTLTKSVIQALTNCEMQSYVLPKSLCDDINKKCCAFIWGDKNS